MIYALIIVSILLALALIEIIHLYQSLKFFVKYWEDSQNEKFISALEETGANIVYINKDS